MSMKRWLTTACVIGLTVVLAAPAAAQGNSNKKGGGGGGSSETPLVVVFRDATGDAFRSDGSGAYWHGDAGIKEAVLTESGNIYVDLNPKRGDDIRGFAIDFVKATQVDPGWGDPPPASGEVTQADFGVYADSGFGYNIEGGVAAVTDWAWARLPVFFADPDVRRTGWKLSYSKSSLRDGTEGVGFARVECAHVATDGCKAWVAHKDKPGSTDSNRAALIAFKPNEANAGEWEVPFAIGFCVRDYVNGPDLEAGCRLLLQANAVFATGGGQ